MQTICPADTEIGVREMVLPNDTNMPANLLGGRLLNWSDIARRLRLALHLKRRRHRIDYEGGLTSSDPQK